jgi:predicted DNA-binding transcriptional regulator AlpA
MNPTETFLTAIAAAYPDLRALMVAVKQAESSKQVILRPVAASKHIGVSRTTLHRLSENDPTFPRKIVLSRRWVGYRTDALDAWLAQKEMGP